MDAQYVVRLAAVWCITLLPGAAAAQALGGIAGVVRDATGAVMPGVTVEAASPALIEKVRTVVTDNQGRYNIVELRAGVYSVTFSLAGFSTVVREGLVLTSGFTATENAELRVGSIEETITVSGASPVVDVQNVRTQRVLSRDVLDSLPTSRTLSSYTALTLGATVQGAGLLAHDVGGTVGDSHQQIAVHGNRGQDHRTMLDGLRIETAGGPSGGIYSNYRLNHLGVEEVVLETSGMTAEAQTGGVQMNVVPKDGGNRFRGVFAGAYAGRGLQSDNLTDELRDRGITGTPSVKRIYDAGGGVGGPIRQNRLWFFTAHRWWGSGQYMPGAYFNKTQDTLFYTPDLSRPAYRETPVEDHSVNVTWQAAQKHKFNFFAMLQDVCTCYRTTSSNRAPESTEHVKFRPPTEYAAWSYTATNRLLIQAAVNHVWDNRWNERPKETLPTATPITELSTGLIYGASGAISQIGYGYVKGDHPAGRVSASYVTGSHALKAGYSFYFGRLNHLAEGQIPPIAYTFRKATADAAPTPVSVTYSAAPQVDESRVWDYGLYVQDQWAVLQKLTLNLGLRFDALHAWVPAQTRPAGPFVGAFEFEKLDNVPLWKDLSPRLGAAYDVFGTGRTAIKASFGRYVIGQGTGIADAVNPANAIVTTATRSWNDADGDYVPEEHELGRLSPSTFGTVVIATRYAPEVLEGFGVRPDLWQATASVQHELRSNVAVSAAYFRTSYGHFTVTDNLRVTPADFDPYCVTAPADPRLPQGGGYPICDLYDVTRSAFGAVDNLVTDVSHFGTRKEIYNGAELSVNARFGRGGLLAGGVSTGRTDFDNCALVDSPQRQFCKNSLPFRGQTQFKLSGAYPLPWNLQASAVFQNLPGIAVAATRSFTNAEIAPGLGRNLSSCPAATGPCTSAATVTLLEPNTQFEDRLTQVDVRLTRRFQLGSRRLQVMADVYNLLNASTILQQVGTFGPSWLQPTEILAGRLFKFGAQYDF